MTKVRLSYNTGKMPDAAPLWSPRVGFNWDVSNDQTTQIRGGSGVFTGKPPYVWISNQIGNTGVLTRRHRRSEHDGTTVQSRPDSVCTEDAADRHTGDQRWPECDRPEFQVPADVAEQHCARSDASVGTCWNR